MTMTQLVPFAHFTFALYAVAAIVTFRASLNAFESLPPNDMAILTDAIHESTKVLVSITNEQCLQKKFWQISSDSNHSQM